MRISSDKWTGKEVDKSGKFVRQKNRFDTPFGEEEGQLPVEAGRYRLLWAPVCPWAHRSIIVRKLTLARFDVAYHNIFRVNKKRLRDYDNLWAYARDLYQTPGFGDTTDFAAIKKHYHIDCNPGNIHQIIAKGPDEEAWLLPHGREKLSEK